MQLPKYIYIRKSKHAHGKPDISLRKIDNRQLVWSPLAGHSCVLIRAVIDVQKGLIKVIFA